MPRPASNPPQRLMKLGCGCARGGVVAGCAGFVGVAAGVAAGAVAVSRAVGAGRWRPRLPPPPKRLAASASEAASAIANAAMA